MKRILLILTLFFSFGMGVQAQTVPSSTPTSTPAANQVIVPDAVVRGGPGRQYPSVGRLVEGRIVTPVNRNTAGDWVLIRYSRGFGWVQRNLVYWVDDVDALPVIDETDLTPSPVSGRASATPFFPTPTPTGDWVWTDARSVYVRAGPGRTYLRLTDLAPGDVVEPVARNEDTSWVMIRLDGGFGWITYPAVRWVTDVESLPIVSADNLTPSPTFTATLRPTATDTPSRTPTSTATNTATSTPTFTATVTSSPTPTNTASPTLTPLPTETDTATHTPSPTDTSTYTSTPTASATSTPAPTDTETPAPTLTATTTQTSTPSSTPTETLLPTATNTPTHTATMLATDTPIATLSPTIRPTDTLFPTATTAPTETDEATSEVLAVLPSQTPRPTLTATPSQTPHPTQTPTNTATSLPTDTPTLTPSATESLIPTATYTQRPTFTPSLTSTAIIVPTETRFPSRTPMSSVTPTVSPTVTATTLPTHTPQPLATSTSVPTQTPRPTETVAPTTTTPFAPTVTATPTQSAGLLPGTPQATETAVPQASVSPTGGVPLEAIIGGAGLLAVMGYAGLYWLGLRGMERYAGGFVLRRCPVCQKGELHVETRHERFLGIPRGRRIVRCSECRSVLREVGRRRWRYAVDPVENPVLYRQYNGREIDEKALMQLTNQPVSTPRPTTPPTFIDDEESR